ncbi:MAG: glycoside hydrolase family 3 N-terminal domain-containing protein [Elusimicrobiota bacterium]
MRAALLAAALAAASGPAQAAPTDSLALDAAQLLVVGARGAAHSPGDQFEDLICGLKVGGLILFERDVDQDGAPRNIRSKEQVSQLTASLHKLAAACGNAPLLIAVDVEGGVVNRLSTFPELKKIKSHAWLGAHEPSRTYETASRIGREMAEAGLNWTLAPVVDVNINPENPVIGRHGRSFSADPAIVTRHAHSFIRGLQDHGVLHCLKHYPGHGSSAKDSHLGAVDVTKTSEPVIELEPYEQLIDRGIVDCVMTAHIFDSGVDPDWIVTFSSRAIEGTLRGALGYEGVVITDDLQMRAVSQHHKLTEAAVLAIRAGNDMVIVSNNRHPYEKSQAQNIHNALLSAVMEGRLPLARVREAAERVRTMKQKLRRREETPEEAP